MLYGNRASACQRTSLPPMKSIAFAVLVVAAHTLFFYNVWRLGRVAALGRPAGLSESWGQRLGSLMVFFFGQRKVMEERASWHHLPIYWGFLVLGAATTEMLVGGLVGDWFTLATIVGTRAHGVIRFAVDVMNLVVLFAILYAFVRRIVLKPPFIPVN